MAQPMQQNTFERRLRPIYDNLEVGNNRKALQETEKLLKKHPNLMCARALKGLALLKLGRYDESNNFLESVTNERPMDDSTLQVLTFCYKELEQFDKIVELYNDAVKQSPGNEELLAHLFISYVRLEDFKSQQSVALQLYKCQPKNSYYFWAVMSVVLQGTRGPEKFNPDKRKIFLLLAQKMASKMIDENRIESDQEIFLYVHILNLQEHYEDALNFLNGPICKKISPDSLHIKINLMKRLGKWSDIYSELKPHILNDHDRWDYYTDFIESAFEVYNINKQKIVDEVEDQNDVLLPILDCWNFINELIEKSDKKIRGPYLARLELYCCARKQNLEQLFKKDFFEMVYEYFELFGDKPCCTHDIAMFFKDIPITERKTIAKRLLNGNGDSSPLPENKGQMQKHLCALQILRISGSNLDQQTEHSLAFYTALKLHYEHGLSLFGKKLLPTELGPSDPYVLLAVNVMYDLSQQERSSHRLFEALCLLQYVLRNSTSNFHVMLASLKIYHMFGCLLGAQEMYEYLDIKHIQLDSMGFIHCNLLPVCGRFSMARTLFDRTLKFFNISYKERLEYVSMIYRYCTFSKLEEFMNFKDRLMRSIHYASISVEAQLCDLVLLYGNVQQNLTVFAAMNIDPSDERISWNELRDNRDLSAIIRWDPIDSYDSIAERFNSYEQEKEILRMRLLLLRLISSLVDLLYTSSRKKLNNTSVAITSELTQINDENSKELEVVEKLLDAWSDYFKRVRALNYKPLPNKFLADLLPTRLHLLLNLPYEKFFSDLGLLVVQFHKGDSNFVLQCKIVCDNAKQIGDICLQTVQESDAAEDGLWRRREWQTTIASTLEILSLYAFILSICYEKLQNPLKNSKGRKKSNLNASSEKERIQLVLELMKHLKSKLQNCELVIEKWKAPSMPRELNSFLADMSIKPSVEATLISDVTSTFKESHEHMVSELRSLIKDKIRMVTK